MRFEAFMGRTNQFLVIKVLGLFMLYTQSEPQDYRKIREFKQISLISGCVSRW